MSAPARLGRRGREAIAAARRIGVSAISLWEVATWVRLQRIELDRPPREWMELGLARESVVLLPLIPAVAARTTDLPGSFTGDPADRLIVATAMVESAAVVTKDRAIRDAGVVRTIW